MSSDNTLSQTSGTPSQEGAPENECNHPCGCSQATYLIVEPENNKDYAKEEDYDYVAPFGYRRAQRSAMWEDIILDTLSRVEAWAENSYNEAKRKQEEKRNKNHTNK